MQEALFTIELKGHSYAFAYGNVMSVDLDNKSNQTDKFSKNGKCNIKTALQGTCINRPHIIHSF